MVGERLVSRSTAASACPEGCSSRCFRLFWRFSISRFTSRRRILWMLVFAFSEVSFTRRYEYPVWLATLEAESDACSSHGDISAAAYSPLRGSPDLARCFRLRLLGHLPAAFRSLVPSFVVGCTAGGVHAFASSTSPFVKRFDDRLPGGSSSGPLPPQLFRGSRGLRKELARRRTNFQWRSGVIRCAALSRREALDGLAAPPVVQTLSKPFLVPRSRSRNLLQDEHAVSLRPTRGAGLPCRPSPSIPAFRSVRRHMICT